MQQTGSDIMSVAMKRRFGEQNFAESSTITSASKRPKLSEMTEKLKEQEFSAETSVIFEENENIDEVDGGTEFDIQTFSFSTEQNFGSDSLGINEVQVDNFGVKSLIETEAKPITGTENFVCKTSVNETPFLKSGEQPDISGKIGSETCENGRSENVEIKHENLADNIKEKHGARVVQEDSESSSSLESGSQTNAKSKSQTTPRIVMYNESDDNSNSNPFAITIFQSLNECKTNITKNADSRNAAEGKSDTSDLKTFRRSSYKVTLQEKYTGTGSSCDTLNLNESETIEPTIEKNAIIDENTQNEHSQSSSISEISQDLQDTEQSDVGSHVGFTKIKTESTDIEDTSTESQNSTNQLEKESLDNEDLDNSDALVNVTLSYGKKSSRKQNVPKRHLKPESQGPTTDASNKHALMSVNKVESESLENGLKYTENDGDNCKNETKVKKEMEELEPENKMVVAMRFQSTKNENWSTKSRKQRKPTKVNRETASIPNPFTKVNVNGPSVESECSGDVENAEIDEVEDTQTNEENIENNHTSEYMSAIVNESGITLAMPRPFEVGVENGQTLKGKVEPINSSSYLSPLSTVQSMGEESPETQNVSQALYQQQLLRMNMSNTNTELLSKLLPDQSVLEQEKNALNISLNETSNIEVIRQLREIRCSRYRKITMSEKREIAEYAKINGISRAASVFNVSKSAVSMWTRMDLDERDDTDVHKKRNCMLGNERFEMLCAHVRSLREQKFKGMTKSEKYEVARYAKLVGVREMSRCVGVALGTVSGWVRQFPSKPDDESSTTPVESTSNKNPSKQAKKRSKPSKHENEIENFSEKSNESFDEKSMEGLDTSSKMAATDNTVVKIENVEADELGLTSSDKGREKEKDEVDVLLAETVYKSPDIEQLFQDNRHLMVGTALDGDEDFKELFRRVVENKVDKFKKLASSDKMAVVQYGKQVGLRRIGRIMGLATGTLSGWNGKYQDLLNSTTKTSNTNMTQQILSQLDSTCSPSMRNSSLSAASLNQSSNSNAEMNVTCSNTDDSVLDSLAESSQLGFPKSMDEVKKENNEVASVKCLFKDKFDEIKKMIQIARTMKFKNITPYQKVEIVKCSKLVGIRPTARVLNIPIGTLSGWISKYSMTLHPAYNIGQEGLVGNQANMSPSQVGLFRDEDLNYSGLESVNSSLASINSVWSTNTDDDVQSFGTEPSSPNSNSVQFQGEGSEAHGPINEAENSCDTNSVSIATENDGGNGCHSEFEEEANLLAQNYVNTARFTF